MGRATTDKSGLYRYTAIILAIVFLVSAGFFFLGLWERNRQGEFPAFSPENSQLEYEGKLYEQKEGIETFLVLGLDKLEGSVAADSYNNDKQADFLMLFVLDNEAKTCAALQINRDTMTKVNVLGVAGDTVSTAVKQIALAHTHGNGKEVSCRNTADAVSTLLLGAKINHYMSVTMDSVPVFNDFLGGVEVTVLDDFTGIDETLVKGATVTLSGQQALTYVRTRYGLEDSSNRARMVRQQQYLTALRDKTLQKMSADEEFAVEATLKMADYLISDRSVTQLQELMRKISSYTFLEIDELQGESRMGESFMEFHPDRDSVEKTVLRLFYSEKQ